MIYIDWYNRHGRHTRLVNQSPVRYEQHHQHAAQAAQPPGDKQARSLQTATAIFINVIKCRDKQPL